MEGISRFIHLRLIRTRNSIDSLIHESFKSRDSRSFFAYIDFKATLMFFKMLFPAPFYTRFMRPSRSWTILSFRVHKPTSACCSSKRQASNPIKGKGCLNFATSAVKVFTVYSRSSSSRFSTGRLLRRCVIYKTLTVKLTNWITIPAIAKVVKGSIATDFHGVTGTSL